MIYKLVSSLPSCPRLDPVKVRILRFGEHPFNFKSHILSITSNLMPPPFKTPYAKEFDIQEEKSQNIKNLFIHTTTTPHFKHETKEGN